MPVHMQMKSTLPRISKMSSAGSIQHDHFGHPIMRLAPAAVHAATAKILQGAMSSLDQPRTLLSRAWSGNSLAAGVEHCLTRAGIARASTASTGSEMAETPRVSKTALLKQLKDCINLPRLFSCSASIILLVNVASVCVSIP